LHWNTFFLYQKSYLLPNVYVVNLLNYLALIIVLKLFIFNFDKSAVNQLVIYFWPIITRCHQIVCWGQKFEMTVFRTRRYHVNILTHVYISSDPTIIITINISPNNVQTSIVMSCVLTLRRKALLNVWITELFSDFI